MFRLLPLSAVLASSLAYADAPARIPVQGTLANTDGTPVVGDLPVVFTLFGAADGTDPLWTETDTVHFDRGTFTVYLGESATLDLALFRDHTGAWLGIAVDGDPEMDLLEVDTVPYAAFAQYAGDAASVGGLLATDLLTVDYQPSWADVQGIPASLQAGITAGNGIVLANGAVSIDTTAIEGIASGVCFSDEASLRAVLDHNYLPAAWLPSWNDVQNRPAGLDDGDDNTTYTAGTGLKLASGAFSADPAYIDSRATAVCFDTEAELTALLNDNYLPAAYVPPWAKITGVPAGFADGVDNDTLYTAGAGIKLTAGAFSVDTSKVAVAGTYSKKVKIQSSGWGTGVAGKISVDGAVALTVGRSYGLVILDRATGAVDFAQSYDVFGDPLQATALATKLAAVNSTKIVVVATSDEPQTNRTANGLLAQMQRCGASRSFNDGFFLADGTRAFQYRSAYAMVGICGSGPNSGYEWYSGDVSSDPAAVIDAAVLVMDGDVIGGR